MHNANTPTDTRRGSASRVAVYKTRAEAGLPLWNPDDSQMCEPIADCGKLHNPKQVAIRQCRAGVAVPVD